MEAISSFGGNSLDNVLGTAKKKISRTLESSGPVTTKPAGGDGVEAMARGREEGGEGREKEKENVKAASPEEEGKMEGGGCADNETTTVVAV